MARLRRTIGMAEDLGSVVRTMKTLAAVNIRQFENASRAVSQYVRTIEMGLQVLLHARPDLLEAARATRRPERSAWVVLGSDQGLCGPFNARITTIAAHRIAEPQLPVVVMGHRVARRLEDAAIEFEFEFRTPGSVAGITTIVADVLLIVGDWQDQSRMDGLAVLHNRPAKGGGFAPRVQQLLPLDAAWLAEIAERPWESRSTPMLSQDADELFHWLAREWLFVRLYQAVAESVAAESAARLLTTQSAVRSIDERLHRLRRLYRTERQRVITEELLDLYR